MWRGLLSCICCNAEDRGKHQPRRKKQKFLRRRNVKKQSNDQPMRNYDEEPIPDVFDDAVVGDPYLVQLYNERLIFSPVTRRVNTSITIQNGYRLYLDELSISTWFEHPIINICYHFTDEELQDASINDLSRRYRRNQAQASSTRERGYIDSDNLSTTVHPSTSASTVSDQSGVGTIPTRHPPVQQRPNHVTIRPDRLPVFAPPPIPRDAQGRVLLNEQGLVPAEGRRRGVAPGVPTPVAPLSDDESDDNSSDAAPQQTSITRRKRTRHTRLKGQSSLHRIVRQTIGDRMRPIDDRMRPPVRFNYDLFRLITFRHSEPQERARHMVRIGIPPNTPNLLTDSTVPYRGSIFNRFRSLFTRIRRREYTPPGPNRPRLDPFTNDLAEQRRYIEAQMALSRHFNNYASTPNVDYS